MSKLSYKRVVNKDMIPTCDIMGVNIAAINMEWMIEFTTRNIKRLSGDYICVSNVHTTVLSYENSTYCNIQNSGILAMPDGGPLSTIGRKRGYTQMRRTTGPNYMEEIFKISVKNGYKHYFYGSTDETLSRFTKRLKKDYPNIEVVGTFSPPFRNITESEDMEIIRNINRANPDFIWVGLGAPKQEKWMFEHLGKVNGLMIGVGAGFDYFAGNIKRAPKWMQENNLEWFYRLIQDPKRLIKRYYKTNFKFIWNAYVLNK